MRILKPKFTPLIIIIIALALVYARWSAYRPHYAQTWICRQPVLEEIEAEEKCSIRLKVEIADTIGKQKRGLSDRKNLKENEGMFFPMGTAGIYSFWMKDMRFPIDIIWIYKGEIIDITENLLPPSGDETPANAASKELTDGVLEVNAGFVKKYNIEIGDRLIIKNTP